jgi:hypothetical protein
MGKAGHVAAGSRETCDQSCAHRVSYLRGHDRLAAALPLQCCRSRSRSGKNDVRLQRHQLGRVSARPLRVAAREPIVDAKVAAFSPAQALQFLLECCDARLDGGIVFTKRQQDADPPRAILCPDAERPCRQRPS